MPFRSRRDHALRRTAGALGATGAVALIVLGATPAAAGDAAVGLVLGPVAPIDGVRPGTDIAAPRATFTNTGGAALDRVWVSYSLSHGLGHAEVPANCVSYANRGEDEVLDSSAVDCEFDQAVRPGVVYAPERTLTVKALGNALHEHVGVLVGTYDPRGENTSAPVRGTAPAVRLVERPEDTPAAPGSATHDGWDSASAKVTAKSTADFRVTGARLRGEVGDTVPLTLRFTDAGPGWVYSEVGEPVAHVRVTVPAGTSVTKADGLCRKVRTGTYDCGSGSSWVDAKGGTAYDFTLRIDKAVRGAKGSVALTGPRPYDTVRSNDAAAVLLDVPGADAATAGGTVSSSTSGGATTTGGANASSPGSRLAATGTGPALPVAAGAAAALVLGAGALLSAHRRTAHRR